MVPLSQEQVGENDGCKGRRHVAHKSAIPEDT